MRHECERATCGAPDVGGFEPRRRRLEQAPEGEQRNGDGDEWQAGAEEHRRLCPPLGGAARERRLADADEARDEHRLRFTRGRAHEERVEELEFGLPAEQDAIDAGRVGHHVAHCGTAADAGKGSRSRISRVIPDVPLEAAAGPLTHRRPTPGARCSGVIIKQR